jgi:hypothetical protein
VACLLATLTLAACVQSRDRVLSRDSSVLPFAFPATFESYDRSHPDGPWVARGRFTFVADANRVVRAADDGAATKSTSTYTFYPFGPQRFLIQANDGKTHMYGVLEVREDDVIATMFECSMLDQQAFRAAGGTITIEHLHQLPWLICWLDRASDPAGLLASIAAQPVGPSIRLVPVQ